MSPLKIMVVFSSLNYSRWNITKISELIMIVKLLIILKILFYEYPQFERNFMSLFFLKLLIEKLPSDRGD